MKPGKNHTGLQYLTPAEVSAIRLAWATRPPGRTVTLKTIGAQFNRSPHTIRNILRGQKYASTHHDTIESNAP